MDKLALSFCTIAALAPAAAQAQDNPHPLTEPMPLTAEGQAMPPAEGAGELPQYRDYRRIERGGVLPDYWWAPGFSIGDWRSYGLYQPMQGHRWVRYYDDALLIDGYGRVWDTRPGLDWSGHAGWSYDERGIPFFAELRGDGYGLDHHGGTRAQAYQYGGGYTYPGYGYSYPGYGYGYGGYSQAGYGGGWVTETTVTFTPNCCCGAAMVEQPYVAPPPPPPPPPSPGERG